MTMQQDFDKKMQKHIEYIANELEKEYNNGTLRDYILDSNNSFRFVVKDDKSYFASFIQIEYGGPATYIDTYENRINCCTASKEYNYDLNSEIVEAIDEIMQEYYYS